MPNSKPRSESRPESDPKAASGKPAPPKLHGWKRWAFPLLTVVLVPLVLLGGLELVLRVAGYGVSPDFWLEVEVPASEGATDEGGTFWSPNPRFGWRFFPPPIARGPVISRIAREPEDPPFRLVLVGGSAALGTPDAAFGVGRMLEVMLQETYPERPVEVVNAAMTAVNSHIVLPIARESLRRLEPDGLLVYLGNNEVVGPYGPGTVFEGFTDSLSAIRWSVWLSGTRSGQLLRNMADGDQEAMAQWRGLEMFEDRKLAAGDPQLEAVYSHLEANLRDLAAAARGAGVPMLLSTVAVNLTDNPPFASVHREDLTEEGLATWQEAYDRGVRQLEEAQNPEQVQPALAALAEAETIDDGYADLHFYLAHAHKLLQETAEAERRWKLARDHDALRFRADARIGEVIRRVAEEEEGVELVDGEAAVAGTDGPPGAEVFWEHVHLNPEGNYRLAEAFFQTVTALPELGLTTDSDTTDAGPEAADTGAPETVGTAPPAPSRETVAERLGLTPWHRQQMVGTILGMTARPPFTGQLGHREVLRQRRLLAAELRMATLRTQNAALERVAQAVANRPDDLSLRASYADMLHDMERLTDSLTQWDEALARLPGVVSWRTRRAYVLAEKARREALAEEAAARRAAGTVSSDDPASTDPPTADPASETGPDAPEPGAPIESPWMTEAIAEMEAILDENRSSPEAWLNLGTVVEAARDVDRAEALYRQTLEEFPNYLPARWNLGTLLVSQGDLDAAETLYREARETIEDDRHPSELAELHRRLGEVLERKESLDQAAAEYRKALELSPDLAPVRNNLGFVLERQGQRQEAAQAYQRAIQGDPSYPLPYFNLADMLLQAGQAERAVEIYAAGLQMAPFNLQARYNLAMALAGSGRHEQAARELRNLLQVAPQHPGALNNLAWLLATTDSRELRNPEEAVTLAERAVTLIPDNPQLLETLARAYAAAGRRGDARDAARRALDAARATGNEELTAGLTQRLGPLAGN